jgi:hypothetical protein
VRSVLYIVLYADWFFLMFATLSSTPSPIKMGVMAMCVVYCSFKDYLMSFVLLTMTICFEGPWKNYLKGENLIFMSLSNSAIRTRLVY